MTSAVPSSSTVYGCVLNDQKMLDRMEAQLSSPPYNAPPKAPVLYIKTRNTIVGAGAKVQVPIEPGVVRIDATVGIVIGRTAKDVILGDASTYIGGYVIVSDITLPHDSYYRPAVSKRCRDGFCPMSDVIHDIRGFDIEKAVINTSVNGEAVHTRSLQTLVRSAARLISDVSQFMTLSEGDVLLVGPPDNAPICRAGDAVRIEVAGLGILEHGLVVEMAKEAA